MAYILHIETATTICSTTISKDEQIIAFEEIVEANHATQITILIDNCLKQAGIIISQLDAVALSNGPGSYTSLRVGASTAKGICYALSIPLIAVDTLETMALAAYKEIGNKSALYCPMIDARRMEVYRALYRPNTEGVLLEERMSPKILDNTSFTEYFEKNQKIVFCGNGAEKFKGVCPSERAVFSDVLCSAQHIVPIGFRYYKIKRFVDTSYHVPEYLKPPNIILSDKRL
jgi:tRNA threonylcarbamoyladenosine biosynthesis protein TsaB